MCLVGKKKRKQWIGMVVTQLGSERTEKCSTKKKSFNFAVLPSKSYDNSAQFYSEVFIDIYIT